MKGKGRQSSAPATDGIGDERERRRLPEIWDTSTGIGSLLSLYVQTNERDEWGQVNCSSVVKISL